MSPAAWLLPARDWLESHRSRGAAAAVTLAIHIALLLAFLVSLSRVIIPPTESVEPLTATFIDQPRGQHRQSDRRAITPRFIKLTPRLANTAPKVDIEVPVELPPSPQPSTLLAAPPPGTRDVIGDGAPSGNTDGPGDGAGPALLHEVPPIYSALSQLAHEQGTVTLRVMVNAQGVPGEIRLVRSSGFPRLDESAIEAVRRYRYAPPARDALPAQSWATANVEFDLLPMPVPTSIVHYNSLLAEQVTAARRSGRDPFVTSEGTDAVILRLANRLMSTVSLPSSGIVDPQHPAAAPTPLQVLAKQGKLKRIRFVGLANADFDCGNPAAIVDPKKVRCEVFEAQQDHGMSYWLALVDNQRFRLQNLLITAGTEPLNARALTR